MSEAEPCPTCKGRCCRDIDLGYRTVHMGAEVYRHDCDDCWDGTYEICGDPEPAPKPVRTAEEERADVVAWLMSRADLVWHADAERAIVQEAYAIERGEHIGAAKGVTP